MNMRKFVLLIFVSTFLFAGCGSSGEVTAQLTTEDLLGALPTVLDLPAGWSTAGSPKTSLEPKSGEIFGNCGKGNMDSRAIANNVVTHVKSPSFQRHTNEGWGELSLYSFGTEEDAKGFIDLTVSQANCPEGLEYEQVEGTRDSNNWKDGKVDIFIDESNDGSIWLVKKSISIGSASDGNADDAFFTSTSNSYFSRVIENYSGNESFGQTEKSMRIYERHGSLIISYVAGGVCCQYGFSNTEGDPPDTTPTFDDVSAYIDIFKPLVFDALRSGKSSKRDDDAPTRTTASSSVGAVKRFYDEIVRNTFLENCQYQSGDFSYCIASLECIEEKLTQEEFLYEENWLILRGELSDRMTDIMLACNPFDFNTFSSGDGKEAGSFGDAAIISREYDAVVRNTFLENCQYEGGYFSYCIASLECIEEKLTQEEFLYEENWLIVRGELSDRMTDVMAACLDL